MSEDDVEALERRMAEAVAAEDFEAAARLRDRIAALKAQGGGQEPGQDAAKQSESLFRRQVPGRMGLGTDQQVFAPPKGWKPPRKPDLFTSNTKPRRGR
jgi:hypothetical protein